MTKEELNQISLELKTQDNRITADPLFCVYDKEKIYGIDDDYTDLWDWCNSNQQCYCSPGDTCESKSDDCKKIGYIERDVFINAHFTEKSAQAHIDQNRYHYNKPFVYVISMWRCPEMINIRNFLLEGGTI